MSKITLYVLTLIALLVPLTARGSSTLTAELRTFELQPGVLIDRQAQTIYAMSPGGTVEAVDLRTGQILWTTTAAAKPLAAVGDRLLAQIAGVGFGVLELVTLDRATGQPLGPGIRVPLQADVRSSVDDLASLEFSARCAMAGGELFVLWREIRLWPGGAPPPPGQPSQSEVRGAARLDLDTGEASPVSFDDLPLELRQPQPSGAELAAEDAGGGLAGVFSSADARHLLHSERVVAARGAKEPWDHYDWSIFSAAGGDRLGRLRHRASYAPFAVVGSTVITVERPFEVWRGAELVESSPLRFEGLDLAGGRKLWQRVIRNTENCLFPP